MTPQEASVSKTILYKTDAKGNKTPTGVVTLLMTALTATPSDTAYEASGDAVLIASAKNKTKDKANIIVYNPVQIGLPYPKDLTDSPVTGQRLIADSTTSPGVSNLAQNQQREVTFYGIAQTITVWDQFVEPLNSLYDGTPVTENGTPINQKISGGTYTDNIGLLYTYAGIAKSLPDADKKTYTNSPPATLLNAYKGAYFNPPSSFPDVSHYDTAVEVGGQALDPAIKGRVLTLNATPATATSPESDTVSSSWSGS